MFRRLVSDEDRSASLPPMRGPVAQWITRWTTDQKIPGLTPGWLVVRILTFPSLPLLTIEELSGVRKSTAKKKKKKENPLQGEVSSSTTCKSQEREGPAFDHNWGQKSFAEQIPHPTCGGDGQSRTGENCAWARQDTPSPASPF